MQLVERGSSPSRSDTPCLSSYLVWWMSARGLDVSLSCARVTLVTDEQDEGKYHWIIMFTRGARLYTYLHRTVPFMTKVLKASYEEHGKYPYRVWVIVDDEIQKVEIT